MSSMIPMGMPVSWPSTKITICPVPYLKYPFAYTYMMKPVTFEDLVRIVLSGLLTESRKLVGWGGICPHDLLSRNCFSYI